MSILFRSLIATLALTTAVPPSPSGTTPQAVEASGSDLQAYVERAGLAPGIAWALVGPGGIEEQGVVGTDGDGEEITADTPFIWGSVAKPITADLVIRLVDDDLLDLDDPVEEIAPTVLPDDADDVTVRDLLDHTSGLPESFGPTDHDRGPSLDPAVDDLRALRVDDRGTYLYSSLNYLALAAVVEAATGQAYADALRQRVLDPLGMTGAAPDLEGVPPGHRYVFGRTVAVQAPADEAGLSYGYLAGSLTDLAAFTQAALVGDVPSYTASDADADYSLGWRHHTLDYVGVDGSDTEVTWHGGAVPGFQTGLMLLPAHDRAIVVVQNAYGHLQDEALLATTVGLAALAAGEEPPEPAGVWNPTYAGILVALVALSAVMVGSMLLRRSWPGMVAAVLAVPLATWGLPTAFRMGLADLRLWAPDVAWTAYACLALAALTVLVASARWAGRTRRQQRRGDDTADGTEQVALPRDAGLAR